MPIILKSGNLNFLEISGPVQDCNGTAFFYILWLVLFTSFVSMIALLDVVLS